MIRSRCIEFLVACCIIVFTFCSCRANNVCNSGYSESVPNALNRLEAKLSEYIGGKDARVGVAVIFGCNAMISINGEKEFPLQSVFKFPLALVVGNYMDTNNLSLSDTLSVNFDNMIQNTYSPMLKKYGSGVRGMTFRELLEWSLMESDNNASDILLKFVGGPLGLMRLMREMHLPENIEIGASEEDMHCDNYKSYLNRATPMAMARLFDRFDKNLRNQSEIFGEIAGMLERCHTGVDRLPAPFLSKDVIIGHKTGTGFVNSQGRLSAINDCGYVRFPDGNRYVIAVFVADSAYDIIETSKMRLCQNRRSLFSL